MEAHREHLIAPNVRGWLESPSSAVIAEDCLIVSGWAFASGSAIVELWVSGLGARRPLRHGLRRDDVARVYREETGASSSGFSGYIEFDGKRGEPVDLEVWARLGDSRTIRLFARRVTADAEAWESPVRFAARQAMRQPRLLLSSRSWRLAWGLLSRAWWLKTTRDEVPIRFGARRALTRTRRVSLAQFLAEQTWITFTKADTPVVSVITVVWNRAELTLRCLAALAEHTDVAMEVIVVDNASTDETTRLLAQVDGATVMRNESNLGFPAGNNVGALAARGEFLLFLNNDAELAPGSLTALVDTARASPTIGAVGGKLVWPDGRLQEAGSIVWADGSCEGYGRGDDPSAPAYNFERPVDFCSGALLLTPRAAFEQLGGFEERYRPMYYEDADYCARLWRNGYRVMYQPQAVALHYEFGSASSPDEAIERQRARRPIFVSRHHEWLASQLPRDEGVLAARAHPHGQPSVILIDDAVPDPRRGSGFPRAAALVRVLADAGFLITIYATARDEPLARSNGHLADCEVIADGPAGLRAFLTSRLASRRPHDLVIVSRPHNMQYVKAAVGADLAALDVPCVYDAEAVYALREIGRRRVVGPPLADAARQALVDAEVALTRGCSAVLVVNEAERQLFASSGIDRVCVVGHAVEPCLTTTPFGDRQSILFVGAFSRESPNEDAVRFFCRDVLPIVRGRGCQAPVVVAGAHLPSHLKALADSSVSWHADIDDLTPLYENARVFVAPSRYAAGIPLKVVEAASRGVPIVCTPLIARQLNWRAGVEVLAAESPEDLAAAVATLHADQRLWERLREAALARAASDFSVSGFRAALHDALDVTRRGFLTSRGGSCPRTGAGTAPD